MRDRDQRRNPNPRRSYDSFSATCDSCGKNCKVPFKPTQGKPVYCDDCFKKQSGSRGGNGRRDTRGPKRDIRSSEQLEGLNKKLDKIIELLENN